MKKRKQITIYSVIALVILAGLLFLNSKPSQVCFDDGCFEVEIAETYEEKTKGLMFRDDLKKDGGMLFVYD